MGRNLNFDMKSDNQGGIFSMGRNHNFDMKSDNQGAIFLWGEILTLT